MGNNTENCFSFRKNTIDIAKRYGLNLDRLESLHKKTDPHPKAGDPSEIWTATDTTVHTNVFGYCLQLLLQFSDSEHVLDIMESENLRDICNRIMFMNYIMHPLGFHYTRDELGKLLGKYSDHLNLNWGSLIKTGYPSVRFGSSLWIDWHLTDLYRTKLPYSATIRPREDGNLECTYKWVRGQLSHPVPERLFLGAPYVLIDSPSVYSGKKWKEQPSDQTAVPYEDAPQVSGLSVSLAYAMERDRQYILSAKIGLLKAAEAALSNGNADELREQSISLLQKQFSKRELSFHFHVDYPDFINAYGENAGPVCGGLICLMNVIGAAEAEIRFGLATSTIEALGTLFIRSDDGRANLKASGAWFSKDELARMDGAMKICAEKLVKHKHFLQQYGDEVTDNLHNGNFEEVSVSVRVPETLSIEIGNVLQDAASRVEETVSKKLANVPSTQEELTSRNRGTASNEFSFKGDHWKVSYGGIAGYAKDVVGMHYLAILLKHPQTSIHVSELVRIANRINPGPADQSQIAYMIEEGNAGAPEGLPFTDIKTIKCTKERLEELENNIEEARITEDIERLDKIEEWEQERTDLRKYLDNALYKDVVKKTADIGEKNRKSVKNAIDRAIIKLDTDHHELADHLKSAVKYEKYEFTYTENQSQSWSVKLPHLPNLSLSRQSDSAYAQPTREACGQYAELCDDFDATDDFQDFFQTNSSVWNPE